MFRKFCLTVSTNNASHYPSQFAEETFSAVGLIFSTTEFWGDHMSVLEGTVRGGASAAKSLFTRIGGEPAVNAAVDLFYKKVVNDPLLRCCFEGTNLRRLQKKQKFFLRWHLVALTVSTVGT